MPIRTLRELLILVLLGAGSVTPGPMLGMHGLSATPSQGRHPPAAGPPIEIGIIFAGRLSSEGSDTLAAVRTAVDFINAERGGAAGRPLSLQVCDSRGSAEPSDCWQRLAALPVSAVIYAVGNADEASLAVFERAGIPVVGAASASVTMLKATTAFFFNAGVAGSYAAMSAFAARNLGARKVLILAENDPIAISTARAFGKDLLRAFWIRDATVVAIDPSPATVAAAMRAISFTRPEVVIAALPERSCGPIIKAIHALASRPKVVYSVTCLSPELLETVGVAGEGAYFETPLVPLEDPSDADLQTFRYAMSEYGAGVPISPSTQMAFQSVMNVVDVMNEIGAPVTARRLMAALHLPRRRPSFMGRPYSCDGRQVPSLPAVCDTHSRVVQYQGDRLTEVTAGWLNPF